MFLKVVDEIVLPESTLQEFNPQTCADQVCSGPSGSSSQWTLGQFEICWLSFQLALTFMMILSILKATEPH